MVGNTAQKKPVPRVLEGALLAQKHLSKLENTKWYPSLVRVVESPQSIAYNSPYRGTPLHIAFNEVRNSREGYHLSRVLRKLERVGLTLEEVQEA